MISQLCERRGEEIANTGTLSQPSGLLLNALGGGASTSGLPVNEWNAEGIPAISACIRAIAGVIASLPLKLVRADGQDKYPDTANPLYWLLHDLPNPETTAVEFFDMSSRHLLQWGNAYIEIDRDSSGRIRGLWPLLPWRMWVDRDAMNRRCWHYLGPNGRTFDWTNDPVRPPIMHLRINSLDGFVGRSPIRVHMDSIGLTLAVSRFGAEFFARFAQPQLVATHPGKLSPTAKQNFRESWEKLRGEWGNKNRMAVLEEGMKLEKMSYPPDEAQYLETRSFQIEECARIYSVPLVVLQHMTKSTSWGTGVESIMRAWLNLGLGQYLRLWSQSIARDCLTQKTFMTHEAVWVTNALLKADFAARMSGYDIQIKNGMLSPNEGRELEDLNRRKDKFGDEYLVPTNNATPTSLATAAATPTPPPANEGD